jgi:hypothetical protein
MMRPAQRFELECINLKLAHQPLSHQRAAVLRLCDLFKQNKFFLLFGLHSSFIGCLLLNGLFPKKRRKLYLRYLWLDLNKTKSVVMI